MKSFKKGGMMRKEGNLLYNKTQCYRVLLYLTKHRRKRIQEMKYLVIVLSVIFSFVLVFSAMSLEPPRPGELEKYKNDGSYKDRLSFAKSLGNDKFDSALVQQKKTKLEAKASGTVINAATFPYYTGLPSSGTPRIFALLVEFPDYPHVNESSEFVNKLFGNGNSANYPCESLANYYDRSSYGDLKISRNSADIYGWYMAQHPRSYYTDNPDTPQNEASQAVIKEALTFYDPTVNFGQYDNNNNNDIDYFCVFWTGPDTGWATLWWGWCSSNFGDDSFTVDGKKLRVFSWQWESNPVGDPFNPTVIIHETGHALGLRDYYDYDATVGPRGGVGGLDMMDSNWGDHNCFSKWLLGWVEPIIVDDLNNGIKTLRDSATNRDCVAVMPGLATNGVFSEYFMVQNRSRVENDSKYPTDGLVIWHVDATLNEAGTKFAFDNSYTSHKLLRLMEADGREEIERRAQGLMRETSIMARMSFPLLQSQTAKTMQV